jgi:glycosyltransferase involved in cell wall biosynthesis
MPYTIRPNVNINFIWQLSGAKLSIWNQRDIGFGFSKKYRDKILWFALKNTSGFISNSIEGIEFIQSYMTIKKPVAHIPNGILIPEKLTSINEIKEEYGLTEYDFIAIMPANLTKYKDHETLLRAWELFENQNPKLKLILLLAGAKKETYKTIQETINDIRINVRCLGFIDNLHSLINACDLCIFSSKKEGVPNAILESMALGKIVIASSIKGNIEALGDKYPLYFKPGDYQDLLEKIQLVKGSFNDLEKTRKEITERISTKFSSRRLFNLTLEFIDNLRIRR